ncbi:hypothetical protein RRG08_049632 [Elysia crispata]|uniref:Uncharacterized protein n=1 Tax=Elysia crispata TaxID=231223 RepID=A0AAE0XZY3_9GAST|nr:hypothetical protein RRG08_049632 [Elysia crispata]
MQKFLRSQQDLLIVPNTASCILSKGNSGVQQFELKKSPTDFSELQVSNSRLEQHAQIPQLVSEEKKITSDWRRPLGIEGYLRARNSSRWCGMGERSIGDLLASLLYSLFLILLPLPTLHAMCCGGVAALFIKLLISSVPHFLRSFSWKWN